MLWPSFPKRLQSGLKALCCLAQSKTELQSREISARIGVSNAETAKILQLLVWGGFVTSRRGTKGGFRLASSAERITMAEVIRFFLAKHHPIEAEGNFPVMRALRDCVAPCQKAFGKLSLAKVARPRESRARRGSAREFSVKLRSH